MKKYYFTWYNRIAQETQTDFVEAENEMDAKQVAVLIMKFFGGDVYGQYDIETLNEYTERYFYTFNDIITKYRRCGKTVEIPVIREDDENEDS